MERSVVIEDAHYSFISTLNGRNATALVREIDVTHLPRDNIHHGNKTENRSLETKHAGMGTSIAASAERKLQSVVIDLICLFTKEALKALCQDTYLYGNKNCDLIYSRQEYIDLMEQKCLLGVAQTVSRFLISFSTIFLLCPPLNI